MAGNSAPDSVGRLETLKLVAERAARIESPTAATKDRRGLWLFYRAHADLGDNWSISLEIRAQHKLVNHGVYERVRHPMYTSIFLQAIAQAFLLPNWVAGPSCLLAFILMFAVRVGAEERMMMKQFGDDYALYMERTKRLAPGVW